MKKIIAVIQPYKLDEVKKALSHVDVRGLTVSEVRGYGRQGGQQVSYRGSVSNTDFVHKLKLEIIVSDGAADQVEEAIVKTARTGKVGDGKIFIHPLDTVTRIRTGEAGDSAV